jgi:hypothetical protein
MQNALGLHNGQRLEHFSPEVKIIAKLTAKDCELKYEITNFEIYYFDVKDIDTKAIKLETIGSSEWVTFNTRNFHRSIRSVNRRTKKINFTSEKGGFSLDSPEIASSFSRTLSRAVSLCGVKLSIF